MSFMISPENNVYDIATLGGAKAFETDVNAGFLLLSSVAGQIHEYHQVPLKVALAWRNATTVLLTSHRPGRPVQQINWQELAVEADPTWAAEYYGTPQEKTPSTKRNSRPANGAE
ncbi:conserved protein of unknown function [Rhodovastum atsumiense]|uniref:Uncharacterized protein n=1 Tax=Rhodovastum atsumiense TaxID=504468 RepID=A0A5M6INK5_9PROT|nr:hypothetical protein [Rhodovastum atsumiense]KAA5609846.1 hypothetical protein F1189_22410 [Rhodovastum atsumiense]CAH2603764.1 conserved protein of unknown function [Rhodovastum atsumiense]